MDQALVGIEGSSVDFILGPESVASQVKPGLIFLSTDLGKLHINGVVYYPGTKKVDLTYDNLDSGLLATTILDAVDELALSDIIADPVTDGDALVGGFSDFSASALICNEAVQKATAASQDALKMLTIVGYYEVGDIFEKDLSKNSLVYHADHFFILNENVYEGDQWNPDIVEETSVVNELSKLRGISTESVYVTIDTVSVIPESGILVRAVNNKTQEAYAEVTLTQLLPSLKIADIPFGDFYTLYFQLLENYKELANLTFKASQIIRNRHISYYSIEEPTLLEEITLKAITRNIAELPVGTLATITVYTTTGLILELYNLDLTAGSCVFNVPLGLTYKIQWLQLNNYNSPIDKMYTARLSKRCITEYYTYLDFPNFKWVTNDFEYIDTTEDIQDIVSLGKLLGILANHQTLKTNNSEFIYVFPWATLPDGTQLKNSGTAYYSSVWSSPIVNAPAAESVYDGLSNTNNAYDAIKTYEQLHDGEVTNVFSRLFETNDYAITVNNTTYRYFIPARTLWSFIADYGTVIGNMLDSYNKVHNPMWHLGQLFSNQVNSTSNACLGGWNMNGKDYTYYGNGVYLVLPVI